MAAATLASRTDLDLERTVGRWLAEACQTGIADSYAGKRRWVRYTWQVPVMVTVVAPGPGRAPQFATSRNLSRGGIGLRCRERIGPMSLVRVTRDETDESVYGRVRHCTGTFGGFLIGIEFEAGPEVGQTLRKSA